MDINLIIGGLVALNILVPGGLLLVFKQMLRTSGKAVEISLKNSYDQKLEALKHDYTNKTEALKHSYSAETESIKHSLTRDLEDYKAKNKRVVDKLSSLDNLEFDAIRTSWDLLGKAVGSAHFATSPLQSYEVDSNCSDKDLEDSMTRLEFPPVWRAKVLATPKNPIFGKGQWWTYVQYVNHLRVAEARRHRNEFHNYVVSQEIIMDEALSTKMIDLSMLIAECLMDYEFWRVERSGRNDLLEAKKDEARRASMSSRRDEIKTLARSRLTGQDA